LLVSSIVSIISWLITMVFPSFSRRFVSQHLELSSLDGYLSTGDKDKDVARFVHSYLRRDGVFALRMLSSHAGV
ncbi:hypothetical protein PFISCL1PPCAC_3737, partial [Pristionchus fissidentatus]